MDDEGGRVSGDYVVTWRDVTLGSTSAVYRLSELTGVHDSPDVRSSDQDRSRAHGQYAGLDLLGGRSIQATLYVVSDDPAVWSTLTSAVTTGNDAESVLTVETPFLAQGRTLRANARCRKVALPVDIDYQFGLGKVSVEWWATDPRFYDVNETTSSVQIATASNTGLEFDAEFDLSFGGGSPTGVVVADNVGNFSTPWSVMFTGPVVAPRIENVTTGQTLRFSGTVAAGEQLVISSADRTVALNGSSRYSWIDSGSRWWDLAPGPNQLRLAASSGTGSATLRFRSAWI